MLSIYKKIITFLFFQVVFSQQLPFEDTSIKTDLNVWVSSDMPIQEVGLGMLKGPIQIADLNYEFVEYMIYLDNQRTVYVDVDVSTYNEDMRCFLIDVEDNDIIGPFYISNSINKKSIRIGPIQSSQFVLQIKSSISVNSNMLSVSDVLDINDFNFKPSHNMKYMPVDLSRELPKVLVTGFWPPTNEMIRHFSKNQELNPAGWQGEDWESLGYDVVSYFPEFEVPDCDNCGQGYGDLEVDYQDTSNDFWDIVEEIEPITIITFSRGFIDHSWEVEYNYHNRVNWYADYSTPFFPTPNPPDDSVPTNHVRHSSLPMQNIVDAINNSDLGLNSYIDLQGDPGHFVSEFMGYHGVWYHSIYEFGDLPCYMAGHVHVGGLIDWDVATLATEETIRTVINYLDQFVYSPGDINSDNIVDVLDLVLVVNHIMNISILENASFYAADMNQNGIINIQDIILILNIILNS